MKKFAGFAAAGIGSLVAVAAVPAQAATPTHISGNFQYTNMSYYCDHGTPNFVFSYRTLNLTESKVTFSATGYHPLVETNVAPYKASQTVTSLTNSAGKSIVVTGMGATTGSRFSVAGKVPRTCAGLPSTMPVMDWKAAGKPTAKPVPNTTKPSPTKSAPTKPAPTTPAPTKPAPTMPAPTKPTGPKVDTDLVRSGDSNGMTAAAGLAGAVALAGGGVVVARRRR